MMSANGNGIRVTIDDLIQLRLAARGLDLQAGRPALALRGGGHHSRFRGRGMDFQESRIYQPGDDIRHMDWRVTARTGKPHTKLYREERERPVIVLLDLNPSMFFGTRVAFKSVTAARAAALLAWATIQQGDRIGAFFFDGRQHHELAPRGGRGGVLRLLSEFVVWTEPRRFDGTASTGMGAALQRLRRVARPGSLIVLFSDFFSLDEDSERHLTQLRQHNDVIACQLWDGLELKPPPPGRYGLSDGKRLGVLDTNTEDLRSRYEHYFLEHHQRVQDLMLRRAVPLWRLATHDDLLAGLKRGLATLGRGNGKGKAA